ncbi:hypothetical protein LRS03_26310 [Rhizobacter sp. J219]|uniref:hypothetical protein n=1 Tax=Rhizobacter sp. J219 TaxID=2898430 RepID=UPI002151B2E7|nr:hypothetical protein [Rhizobacter sp. J219]MCR5886172.1 hypothetical protein [Rhizobacter sp. J219]
MVGHSAGSIVSSFMIDRLVQEGMHFESVSFMAPAVRIDTFDKRVRPHLQTGAVKRYQQFHLTDRAEQDDGSCGAYRRSLLYLVSEAFEGGAARRSLACRSSSTRMVRRCPTRRCTRRRGR